jgi:RimJ/RimL family protein N-acetyltransferase
MNPAVGPQLEEHTRFWSAHQVHSASSWREVGPADARTLLAQEQSRRLLNNERASKVVVRRYGAVVGVACLTPLDWDTEQFGFPAARLEIHASAEDREQCMADHFELLKRVLDDCRRQGVAHLIARVDAGELTTIHALEHGGFELIDGIQTFSRRLTGREHESPLPSRDRQGPDLDGPGLQVACSIRLYQEADLPQIEKIARSSYIYDRFHADYALSTSKADAVNAAWVRNCCLGKMADAVIVAAEGDAVLGYATCKIDRDASRLLGTGCGVIGMVATSEAARNRGIAAAATHGALEWFRRNDVTVVEVGTQIRNVPAGRLYERCGFRLSAVNLTFRKWISDWNAISSGGTRNAA